MNILVLVCILHNIVLFSSVISQICKIGFEVSFMTASIAKCISTKTKKNKKKCKLLLETGGLFLNVVFLLILKVHYTLVLYKMIIFLTVTLSRYQMQKQLIRL